MNEENTNRFLGKIIVHTVQHPGIEFCDPVFEKKGKKTVFSAQNEEVRMTAAVHVKEGIAVLEAGAELLKRENDSGFPDSFRRDNGMEIVLSLKGEKEFAAVHQHKAWWTRPAFGLRVDEVPERTQLLIRKDGGEYEILLAVCNGGMRTDLKGCEDGLHVGISFLRDNVRSINGMAVICGMGTDPYETLARCVSEAKKISGSVLRTVDEKSIPGFMKGIGWCTWDSLGQNVSEDAILEKMEEFRNLGIPITYVLIDDGWSYVNRDSLKLKGLDADPERFPDGIAGIVRILKDVYQVKYVGVWQAFKGYWYGIEEGSEAHLQMRPFLMRYADGEITVRPTPDAAFGFWNRWHEKLRKDGIDFVKVDGQGSVPTMLLGDCPDNEAMKNLYRGLEASSFLNFDGNLINCMGMAPENVWNRSASALSRTSDDYTPTVSGSIVEHLMQNCFNNVWQGDLYLGDWDMFWSDHEENEYSAMLRAVSGGPVYVSDPLGHTDRNVIEKLICRDGSLLRCDTAARPALDCLTRDPLRTGGILKICSTCGQTGYVGCFSWNLPQEEAISFLRWEDIPAHLTSPGNGNRLQASEKPAAFLVYDRETDTLGSCSRSEPYEIRMHSRSAKILELVPGDMSFAAVGIKEKYISGAAVERVTEAGDLYVVRLKCPGHFVFSTERKVKEIRIGKASADFRKTGKLFSVFITEDQMTEDIMIITDGTTEDRPVS